MAESIAARIERLPESGWVSHPIRGEGDIAEVIALFRMNYDRVR